HLTEVGHFNRVTQNILAIAGAIMQPAKHFDDLGMYSLDVALQHCLFAHLTDVVFNLLLGHIDDLFDAGGMDAAVGDEFFHGDFGNLASYRVEAIDRDHTRGVIDDDIDARGLLEGADVSTLAADDAAFHVITGDLDAFGCAFAGDLGGVALHRL